MPIWYINAFLAALFAALTAIFIKVGLENIDSDLGAAIRTVVILIIAWALVLTRGVLGQINDFSRQNWIFLISSGVAAGLSWIFYFRAMKVGEVSKVVSIDKLSVVIATIFAAIFLGESLSIRSMVGIGLIVFGVILISH